MKRVQIDRILMPEQREPVKDRVLFDVDLAAVAAEGLLMRARDREDT